MALSEVATIPVQVVAEHEGAAHFYKTEKYYESPNWKRRSRDEYLAKHVREAQHADEGVGRKLAVAHPPVHAPCSARLPRLIRLDSLRVATTSPGHHDKLECLFGFEFDFGKLDCPDRFFS